MVKIPELWSTYQKNGHHTRYMVKIPEVWSTYQKYGQHTRNMVNIPEVWKGKKEEKRKSKAGNHRVRQISKKCPNFATTAHVQREAIVSSGGNKPCDVILCKKTNTFMIDVQNWLVRIFNLSTIQLQMSKKHSSLLIV